MRENFKKTKKTQRATILRDTRRKGREMERERDSWPAVSGTQP
jgi:hypothetical protein